MGKGSFVFYHSWGKALKLLNSGEAMGIVAAMCEFSETGASPDIEKLTDTQRLVWTIVFDTLKTDCEKYQNKVSKATAAGKASGEARHRTVVNGRQRTSTDVNGRSASFTAVEQGDRDMLCDDLSCSEDVLLCPEKERKVICIDNEGDLLPNNAAESSERSAFLDLWEAYPERKRGNMFYAKKAFENKIGEDREKSQLALNNLERWKRSDGWSKNGGQFIPNLERWLEGGNWENTPYSAIPKGASGGLGQAELEAIQQTLGDSAEIGKWAMEHP